MVLELVPTLDTQVEVHGFSDAQERMLQEALPTSLIKERKGPGGRMLKYITGKTSIDAANRIFGFGKWGYRVLSKSHEKAGEQEYYTADIELYVLGCPFPFPGEGVGVVTSSNVEGHEKARKEAVTDAMKRALRHFGDQFGLALYSEDSLVEDAQGNLVQVKNMHAGTPAPLPVKRVIDSKPAKPLTNGDGSVAQPKKLLDCYSDKLNALLLEFQRLQPQWCAKHSVWHMDILRSVLTIANDQPFPAHFNEDDEHRFELYVESKREKAETRGK